MNHARTLAPPVVTLIACFLSGIDRDSLATAQQQSATTSAVSQSKSPANQSSDEAPSSDTEKIVVKARLLTAQEFPIACRTEEWSADSRIEQCVPHGARVKQGDVLVRLRTRSLDTAIEDQQHAVVTARLAAQKGHEELEHLRKTTRQAVADARRAERIATEDLKRFVTIERDQRQQALEFNLQNAEDYLAYQEEELKQLIQMYEADELTEETEEIILRRTRDDVKRSRENLVRTRQAMEKGLQVEIPRSQEELETQLKRASLALDRVVDSTETEIAEKEAGVAKLDRDLERAEAQLARLTSDEPWLTLRAPADGFVYWGEQRLGVWPDPTPLAAGLRPGNTVKPHQVLMTVVAPAVGQAVATIEESQLAQVAKDRRGTMTIAALPAWTGQATVIDVSPVPVGDGKFLATFQPELPQDAERLVPGMACEITFEKND